VSNAWYARYAGDYGRDTAHLSLTAHGAYTLLLDHYYSTRSPIPKEKSAHYRICRAVGKRERAAVDLVMRNFFQMRDDGYHNSRADSELAKQAELKDRLSRNGRKGAEKKWSSHGPANGHANGPASGEANGPTMAPGMAYPQPQPQPQEEKEKHTSAPSAPGECERLVAEWNAERGTLAQVTKLTNERRAKITARLCSDPDFSARFIAAVRKARQTPFLCGQSEGGWSVSFDWLVKNNTNYLKVLEGNYDNGNGNGSYRPGTKSAGAVRPEAGRPTKPGAARIDNTLPN
jgi:uncharacterized protein YdaU (DUF1376 family)